MSDRDLRLLAWAQNIAISELLIRLVEGDTPTQDERNAALDAHEAFLSWAVAHEADDSGLDFSDAVIADAVKRWNR